MDAVAALISRRRLALVALPLAAVAALAGCGNSSTDDDVTPAQRLAQRGMTWRTLQPTEQGDALRACRLDAAVRIADGWVAEGGVARSAAYHAVLELPADELRHALAQRFAQRSHAVERIGAGCREVIDTAMAQARVTVEPRADFGPPVRASSHGQRLTVHGDAITLRVRVSPAAGARLSIGPAPGRARSTARVTVTQRGDQATVRLVDVPRGTSYLRATVTAGAKRWHRVLTVRGERAPRLAPPRTFAPMVLHGRSSQGIPLLYLPQDARATVTTEGAPLTVTAGDTLVLAHSLRAGTGPSRIPAGRYRDLRVTTSGPWEIRIVPAR